MILYIDTVLNDKILLALIVKSAQSFKIISSQQIKAPRQQSEKLLPAIDSLLKKNNLKSSKIEQIIVNNHGGSFTSLRIGVITANALAFALKIPVVAGVLLKKDSQPKIEEELKYRKNEVVRINYLEGSKSFDKYFLVEPFYSSEPKIGQKKTC